MAKTREEWEKALKALEDMHKAHVSNTEELELTIEAYKNKISTL